MTNYVNLVISGLPLYLFKIIYKLHSVCFTRNEGYHPADTYVPFEKQFKMLKIISYLNAQAKKLVAKRIPVSLIAKTGIIDKVVKIKYDVPNDQLELLDGYFEMIDQALAQVE